MIRFYQVYFLGNDVNPRCLHQWKPHDGKVISSFFFLDNHTKECADNTLWKHAITCSDNNTEIKLWSCETWECKQTINFKACPGDDLMAGTLCFKAEMDRTSSYLVLSDMQNRQLYVLQIVKVSADDDSLDILNGSNSGSGKNTSLTESGKEEDEGGSEKKRGDSLSSATSSTAVGAAAKNTQCTAYIKSIAEFPLSSSILSFGIVDAAVRKYKCTMNDACLIDELDDYDDENNVMYCVIIHMFLVQPKSVQDAHVLYQPTLNESAEILSTISGDSEGAIPAESE
jgi:enhancer of mRNA-decapping protein 4